MQVRIWGARGSLPSPMSPKHMHEKLRRLLVAAKDADLSDEAAVDRFLSSTPESHYYGGNTSCVEIHCGEATFILDAGSGIRALAEVMAADGRLANSDLHLLFTHFHWDHICGLPFFVPIYIKDRQLDIWSWREADDIERILRIQMDDAHFPVKWPMLTSKVACHQLDPATTNQVGSAEVQMLKLEHPDGAYGYRVTHSGRSVCYLTDTEVSKNPDRYAEAYATFVEGADLVLVDAMYGFLDYHEHYNYGHSSIFTWIDFFRQSDIGELVVFHHDPAADDPSLDKLLQSAKRYQELVAEGVPWKLSVAFEGQSWSLDPR